MTDRSHSATADAHWSVLGPEVPSDLSGRRVLEVGDDPEGSARPLAASMRDRGAGEVVQWRFPRGLEDGSGEPFDLVYCCGSLQRDPHPMNLLTGIWHLTRPGSTLLLESQIITAPEVSRYGLFVTDPEDGSSSHWVPGRLALRWMVEASGFDVDRWLATESTEAGESDRASAYLSATRTERAPALDLANPHAADEGSAS